MDHHDGMHFSHTKRARFLWGILLGLLGFAINWFRLELYFNIDFLFGSICVLVAIARLGAAPGLVAGAIAGSCTWLLWHHPWAVVILTCEALVVGSLVRRRNISLVAADTLYWILLGCPLVWGFYHHLLGLTPHTTAIMALKQTLNGISNAIVAQLVLLVLQSRTSSGDRLPSIRTLVFTLILAVVQLTGMSDLITDLRGIVARQSYRLAQETRYTTQVAATMLDQWTSRQQSPGTTPSEQSDPDADHVSIHRLLAGIAVPSQTHLTLLDQSDRVIASTREDLQDMQPFPHPPGHIRSVSNGVMHWVPPPRNGTMLVQRWQQSLFIAEQQVRLDLPWRVRVELSPLSMMDTLYRESILEMARMLIIFLVTAGIADFICRRTIKPLEELRSMTGSIPTKIPELEGIGPWPASRVSEIAGLSENFRNMTELLAEKFRQQVQVHQHLIQEMEKRQRLEESMTQLRTRIEEEERRRIARDIHDGLGQTLQAIKLNLKILQQQCKDGSGCQGAPLDGLIDDIARASDDLREIVTALRPGFLEATTLDEALDWYCTRISKGTGLSIELYATGDFSGLDGDSKLSLFRVLQEALANVSRHARATSVRMSLAAHYRMITLSISDNGRGGVLDPPISGSGLSIMRERVALLGGTFHLSSPPGEGTHIHAEVPLS